MSPGSGGSRHRSALRRGAARPALVVPAVALGLLIALSACSVTERPNAAAFGGFYGGVSGGGRNGG